MNNINSYIISNKIVAIIIESSLQVSQELGQMHSGPPSKPTWALQVRKLGLKGEATW